MNSGVPEETCCHFDFSENPLTDAGLKNDYNDNSNNNDNIYQVVITQDWLTASQ